MRVIVAHPLYAGRYAGRGLHWIYADERLDAYERIAAALGEDARWLPARAFQEAVARLQPEFVAWTDVNVMHSDISDVLLTPLHRNPFSNNLLLHLTWLSLLSESADTSDTLLVFTESAALASAIENVSRARTWHCRRIGGLAMALGQIKLRLLGCVKLCYEFGTVLVRMFLSRLSLRADHLARCRQVELLIDSYFYRESLGNDANFRDKHLPGLVDWYRDQGIKVAIYPFFIHIPIAYLPTVYSRMQVSETVCVPWERFVAPPEAVRAVLRCLSFGTARGGIAQTFRGIDVARLVSSLRFQAATTGLYPLLLAQAPRQLYAAGVKPKVFLDWYENQPLDKANAAGFSRHQPDCRLVALRQYALYPNFANLYTTDREVAAGVCPPETWVSGRGFIPMLRRHDHLSSYRIVPALRYAGLPAKDCVRGKRDLVVALTHSGEESLAILAMVFPAIERCAGMFAAVRIKPHPDFPLARFREQLWRRWSWAATVPWLHWESCPMRELINEARVMVTAGTSAALEALCSCVPVILAGRRAGLDMNPLIGADPRIWTVAYDPADVERALTAWSTNDPLPAAEAEAISEAVRADFFEPIDEKRMRAFLP